MTTLTIYREYRVCRFVYWTNADGRSIYMPSSWAIREAARGARLVTVQ